MNYVIIGNGIAGTTAAAKIRNIDGKGNIKIFSDEPYPFYSRMRLTDILAGKSDKDRLIIRGDEWYDQNKIELFLNNPVTDIDIEKKEIITGSKEKVPYDKLLLATGGTAFKPPIQGADKKGVFTLRTMEDTLNVLDYLGKSNKKIVVIGGGVLGLEAGNCLLEGGFSVTVVEFFPRLLPRQMDPEGAEILKSQMESMGFSIYLGAESQEIIGGDRAEALILKDGSKLECDMILISAGIRPKLDLAKKLDLKIERGLVVNDRMETSIPDIFAAGDLIQHNNISYGIWMASEKQGEIAGMNMAGGSANYKGTVMSNRLKVMGIDLLAAGNIDAENKYESIVKKDKDNFVYRKLIFENNVIIGTILYGDLKDNQRIMKAINTKRNIVSIKDSLKDWNLEEL